MVESEQKTELRDVALEQIRVAVLELSAGRIRKSEQVHFAFGVVTLARELSLITEQESNNFDAIINRHY